MRAPSRLPWQPSPAPARMLGHLGLTAALLVLVVAGPASAAGPAPAGGPAGRGLVASAPGGGTPLAAPVRTAPEDLSEGLRVEDATTYRVDLPGSVVRVENIARITNQLPAGYFFDEHWVPVQTGATNVSAALGDGTSASVRTEPRDEYLQWVVVELPRRLEAGQETGVRVTYDLATQPAGSTALTQVNAAFATFPLFAGADPGLASVRVEVPEGPAVEVVGHGMRRSAADGTRVWAADALTDPAAWWGTVEVRDDDRLVTQTVPYEGTLVLVEAWPGDARWLESTTDVTARGLPALRAALGRPWSVGGRLTVQETAPTDGTGGWYSHGDSRVYVGSTSDAHATLHQLAQAWFNEDVFETTWLNVGLSGEVAAVAMEDIGMDRPVPEAPGPAGAVALDAWVPGEGAAEEDAYAVEASAWLAHQLVEEIGVDALAEVVDAAATRVPAYPAPSDERRRPYAADWRRFLDLVEGVGGSTTATDLFREVVVTEDQESLLEDRTAARATYQEIVERGDGWAPPQVLRDAMSAWRFEDAQHLARRTAKLLSARDALVDELAAAGVDAPGALQETFESADDLAALMRVVRDARAAAQVLGTAEDDRATVGPLGTLGLWTDDVEGDLAATRTALEAGDYTAAGASAESVATALGTATRDGVLVLVAAATLVAGGAGATVLVLRRRRRQPVVATTDGTGKAPAGARQAEAADAATSAAPGKSESQRAPGQRTMGA